MRKNELFAVWEAIYSVGRIIENLFCGGCVTNGFEDKDMEKLFFKLNEMSIALHDKIEADEE